ncbi:hypothetical protein RS030_192925 [Cryptosporidium xiaoi]|uniref:Uncharacterized protein n=1 Tax=Cryptosporidium xiaoi TaxID=659607 RepID=A0AAV9XYH0_9CRYT
MTKIFKLVLLTLFSFNFLLNERDLRYTFVESLKNNNIKQLEIGINDPNSEPDSNLDRSKRLRDGLFEPCKVWTIRNDKIDTIYYNGNLTNNKIPIIGLDSFGESDEIISESILSEKDSGIDLYKPYEGVLVEYNLTSFSRFVSRIVEVEIEMHLKFDKNIMKTRTKDKFSFFTLKNIRGKSEGSPMFSENVPSAINYENDTINEDLDSSLLSSGQYQSISFLLVAGYFKDNDELLTGTRGTGKSGVARRIANKYKGIKSRDIRHFVPVFRDNVTLSRQNANQYYARYGITTFKDKLTCEHGSKENADRDGNTSVNKISNIYKDSNIYINDNKINIDQHKLSFMYLPHNDTKLYFSSNSEGNIVLPKLHIKAIQTHQEATDDPVNDNDSSEEEKSRSKKIMIVTLLLITMFSSFIILFYIIISWYLREMQNKHP